MNMALPRDVILIRPEYFKVWDVISTKIFRQSGQTDKFMSDDTFHVNHNEETQVKVDLNFKYFV